MSDKTCNILFLCTCNSARSIMAEALATTKGQGLFKGYSAGSRPAASVHPFAIEQVLPTGYPVEELRSKSWEEFAFLNAPEMDLIVTLCDSAAGEACPIWPGRPVSAHWPVKDPLGEEDSEEEARAKFGAVFRQLSLQIDRLLSLPLADMDKAGIEQELKAIADAGASHPAEPA